ncbi:hypothetical protein BEE12_16030 [Pantoea agglomerans]|uniref:hypothetical protein n=1 Tax=Enterobacter agglomerans TaxID=549 RepID=UPI00083CA8AD|nr:hypothetical protein [Pantoea agglomerans]AOE41227.1 hypothetical protein BEE12_16030 [Pantoea agglomerans]
MTDATENTTSTSTGTTPDAPAAPKGKPGRPRKLETPGLDTQPIPPEPTPATAEPLPPTDAAPDVPQKLVDSTQPLTLAKVIPVPPEDEDDEPKVRLIPGNRFESAQRMGAWLLTENGWIKE